MTILRIYAYLVTTLEAGQLERLYETLIPRHFAENRQMLFLMGPRQEGKTTAAQRSTVSFSYSVYLNWDNQDDRLVVLNGPREIAERCGVERLAAEPPLCILDEIHTYGRWKNLLKGLFDTYSTNLRVMVTGSSRLDVFKAGGDSLMGRYFGYRLHPLSVAELTRVDDRAEPGTREPQEIDGASYGALVRFGGFPEPFVRQDVRFYNRWRRLRTQQLFRDDLRDLTRIQEVGRVEVLAELIRRRAGQLTSYSSLANAINASVDSVKRWLMTLQSLYYCFPVRPWSKNISRALRKEPKCYLWDWSQVENEGRRYENLIASALLKAVDFWNDDGFGDFGLFFIRDKQKHEVDFVVTRDDQPWFLAKVKTSGATRLTRNLTYFMRQTGAKHAFQVAIDLPFVERNCFEIRQPVIVPAKTFLSQLV